MKIVYIVVCGGPNYADNVFVTLDYNHAIRRAEHMRTETMTIVNTDSVDNEPISDSFTIYETKEDRWYPNYIKVQKWVVA